jgi:hypothetical protein
MRRMRGRLVRYSTGDAVRGAILKRALSMEQRRTAPAARASGASYR